VDELVQYAEMLINFIESRGKNLNVETQQALAEFLQEILQVISENQNPVAGLPPPLPPVPAPKIPSSNVDSFGYDDKTGRLLVRFLGDYPNRNGPIYAYQGVPKVIFELFQAGAIPARTNGSNKWGSWWKGKTPSLGASLSTLIKGGGYQYDKLT
jgi:hypothetical protein